MFSRIKLKLNDRLDSNCRRIFDFFFLLSNFYSDRVGSVQFIDHNSRNLVRSRSLIKSTIIDHMIAYTETEFHGSMEAMVGVAPTAMVAAAVVAMARAAIARSGNVGFDQPI